MRSPANNPLISHGDITKSDISKLNSEINQIVNQRFVLNGFALTFFWIFNGWFCVQSSALIERSLPSVVWAYSLALLFLAAIFGYSTFLTRILRTFTSYLKQNGFSQWEQDWEKFRKVSNPRYPSYSFAQWMLFLFLGAASSGFPLKVTFGSILGVWVIALLALYLLVITLIHCAKAYEDQLDTAWNTALGLNNDLQASLAPTPSSDSKSS